MTACRVPDAEAVALLREMLAVPSFSFRERPLARYLAEAMTGLGMPATIDASGNVIGEASAGTGPYVLLVGHLDTAPGLVTVRREDDRLYGRGAADAKGPLAAMIVAAARYLDFPGRLVVAGVVEEETPRSGGAVHLARSLARPDAVIVGEPGGWPNVVIGYKGRLDLLYRIRQAGAHPTRPAATAAESAADFWNRAAAEGDHRGHARFDQPGMTLHCMSGDMEMAELAISVRTPPGYDVPGLVERLRALAVGADVEVVHEVGAVLADRRNPAVRALSAAVRRQGGTPALKVKTATSDMNTLASVWRTPIVTYGPGDSHLDHTPDEHIEVTDYLSGAAVLRDALHELAQTLPPQGRPADDETRDVTA